MAYQPQYQQVTTPPDHQPIFFTNNSWRAALTTWLVIASGISLSLTAMDPVFKMTYRFPNSPTDTISHEWDCLSFGGIGIAFGVLTFLLGIVWFKHGLPQAQKINPSCIDHFNLVFFIIMFLFSISFLVIGVDVPTRQNHVDDPDLSHDVAITSEGFELPYKSKCGDYMYMHHPQGFVGAFFWSWAILGVPIFIILYNPLLYILKCFVFSFKCFIHLFVCENVCPELNGSLERDLEQC